MNSTKRHYNLPTQSHLSFVSLRVNVKSDALLPLVVKDNYWTKNMVTSAGSAVLKMYCPMQDSQILQNLSKWYNLIGKSNMDEFGCGSCGLSYIGQVKNPFPEYGYLGGSSAGDFVNIHLGYAALAIGSSTGGSAQEPCYVFRNEHRIFGFKPSWGAISRWGLVPMAQCFDTVSLISKDIKHLKIGLRQGVKSGGLDMTHNPNVWKTMLGFYHRAKSNVLGRVAIIYSPGDEYNHLLSYANEQGWDYEVICTSDIRQMTKDVYWNLMPIYVYSNCNRYFSHKFVGNRNIPSSEQPEFMEEVKRRIKMGRDRITKHSFIYYAQKYKSWYINIWRILGNVDLILTPVRDMGVNDHTQLSYLFLSHLLNRPSICWENYQLIGKRWHDLWLLKLFS